MEKSAVERIIEEIKKIEEKDFIDPITPKKEGEEGLGIANTFAKRAYTYWRMLDSKLEALKQRIEIVTERVEKMTKDGFLPEEEKLEGLKLCVEGEKLTNETELSKSMFWLEVGSQSGVWNMTGIRKGFEMVGNVASNPCTLCGCISSMIPPHVLSILSDISERCVGPEDLNRTPPKSKLH